MTGECLGTPLDGVAINAPAKINLYLHIVGRRADGYHELDSLVGFTAHGDAIQVRQHEKLYLEINGSFGSSLQANDDNLIVRAARALAAFEGRKEVTEEDIARVVSTALRHRLRKDPLEQVDSGDRVIKAFCKVFERNESNDVSEFELATTN